MGKIRVYQLAKELEVQSALILELLDRMGTEVKSDLSTLDPKTAGVVRTKISSALETEKKRLLKKKVVVETPPPAAEPAPAAMADVEAPERPVEIADAEPVEPAPVAAETRTEIPDTVEPTATPAPVPETTKPAVDEPAAEAAVAAAADGDGATASAAEVEETPAVAPPPAAGRIVKVVKKEDLPTPAPARASAPGAEGDGPRKPRVFAAKRLIPHSAAEKLAAARAARVARARTQQPPRPVSGGGAGPGAGGSPRPTGVQRFGPPPPGAGPRPGPRRRKRKKDAERAQKMAPIAAQPKRDLPPVPEEITLSEAVTVKELAEKLNRKSKDVIAKLISRGVLATINQPLDQETAVDVAKEFGSTASIITFEEEAQLSATPQLPDEAIEQVEDRPEDRIVRPPVVTVMGHVDHGKTSLLDAIRAANVAEGEAGGITQHIGAYQVEEKGRKLTFLDTPGHEAFTLMRARGSRVTDIVVLVVAADDGVKPQTIEAIDHAKAAGVPLVVAINKIDKSNAQPDRVKQQLMERELVIEEYGGDIVACEISAKERTGIDQLLDMILLVADMKELIANPSKPASGVVLETKLDRSRGVLSTVLVQDGTLRIGDPFIAGAAMGRVRAMIDEHGKRIDEAGPACPVEVMGFNDEPAAGDSFQAVADETRARQIAGWRADKIREEKQRKSARRSLENLASDIAAGEIKELPIILKADSQGSVEALQKSLADLPSDKVKVKVVRASIGAISRADVLLAAAGNAIMVGFNVRPDRATADLAKEEDVELRLYSVIYDLLDDIRSAMVGLLAPTLRESVLGQAEVRELFKVPKLGVIAGCYVTDGKVSRKAEVRLLRDNVVIYTGKVGSLRRFKDDVAEVKSGYECGIGIANYNDLKEGDAIEFFVTEEIAAKTL